MGIIAYALFQHNQEPVPEVFLIPLCIIIPMSIRISYYRTAMIKLAAYIKVYIESQEEGLTWETFNTQLILSSPITEEHDEKVLYSYEATASTYCKRFVKTRKFVRKLLDGTFFRNYECFMLSVMCFILYWLKWYGSNAQQGGRLFVFLHFLWPIPFLVWEYFICRYSNAVSKERAYWEDKWKSEI